MISWMCDNQMIAQEQLLNFRASDILLNKAAQVQTIDR